MKGIVLSINVSKRKGEKKHPVRESTITSSGIEGDAHAGNWNRQVSLLAYESIEKIRSKGFDIRYGDFAENLTVKGLNLSTLNIGDCLKVGREVILEVTQIGKKCHEDCVIKKQIGRCIMPTEGVFTRVISGGKVKIGDNIEIMKVKKVKKK